MRAADCEDLPPEERPFWYKPRPRGHAGHHRLVSQQVQLSDFAIKRMQRAFKIQRRLRLNAEARIKAKREREEAEAATVDTTAQD
ncbi:MAG: hypothetical protein VW405_02795 [Rhodospirillaceae bacterium]